MSDRWIWVGWGLAFLAGVYIGLLLIANGVVR